MGIPSRRSFLAIPLFGLVLLLSTLNAFADVQITKLTDIPFGSWGGSGDMEQTDQFCVYNTVDDNYSISATTPSGAFRMTDGGNVLPYEVRIEGSDGWKQMTYSNPTTYHATTTTASCTSGTNVTLKITVTESALSAATPGNYSGIISFILVAN